MNNSMKPPPRHRTKLPVVPAHEFSLISPCHICWWIKSSTDQSTLISRRKSSTPCTVCICVSSHSISQRGGWSAAAAVTKAIYSSGDPCHFRQVSNRCITQTWKGSQNCSTRSIISPSDREEFSQFLCDMCQVWSEIIQTNCMTFVNICWASLLKESTTWWLHWGCYHWFCTVLTSCWFMVSQRANVILAALLLPKRTQSVQLCPNPTGYNATEMTHLRNLWSAYELLFQLNQLGGQVVWPLNKSSVCSPCPLIMTKGSERVVQLPVTFP